MTVGATTIKEKPRGRAPGRGRMLRLGVTLSAEPGISNSEQAIVNRPVRFMTSGAILQHRGVFPKKRSAPLSMTGVTVFIDSGLDKLCWIRRSVRIMTVRTGQLSLSKRHMGRTHELRFTLEVALAADFCLRALVKERGPVADLGKLIPVGSLFHDGVAVNATHASPRMRARLPMGLHTALMTSEAGLVLDSYRLSCIFPKSDKATNAFTTTRTHVVATGTVAIFAGSLFSFVAWVMEKNFPHHRGGEFFKGWSVTRLADFVADVGGRSCFLSERLGWFLGRFLFGRPSRPSNTKQEHTS